MYLKSTIGFNTSEIAKKVVLAILKPDVEELDIDKLINVPSGLNSLKRKADKLDVDNLKFTSTDSKKKKNNVVGKNVLKKIKRQFR